MSFSEYNGSKAKVTQAVGRIFKNAQESFTKIQPAHAVGSLLKTMSPSGSNNGCEHERMNKPALSTNKFGFQKLRLRNRLEKKRSNRRAELLDNQETGDHEDSGDEFDTQSHHYPPLSHADLTMSPSSHSLQIIKTPKRWPF